MDFDISESAEAWRNKARKFGKSELAPHAETWDREGQFPTGLITRLADEGYLGLNMPRAYGGHQEPFLTTAIVLEELAAHSVAVAGFVRGQLFGPTQILLQLGDEDVKRDVLPRIVEGTYSINMAMTETGAGSDLGALESTAVEKGDKVVVSGRKHMITSGFTPDEGFMVFCRLGERESKNKRPIVAALVDGDDPNVALEKAWDDKLGQRSSRLSDVSLSDCEIARNRVFGDSDGLATLLEIFNLERCSNGLMSLGIARASFAAAVEYCDTREQFAEPISAFQQVQAELSEMALKLESARLLLHRAIWDLDNGRPVSRYWSSLAKMQANDAALDISMKAIKLHGGRGYHMFATPARDLRDAIGYSIAGGMDHLLKVGVADELSRHRLRPGHR